MATQVDLCMTRAAEAHAAAEGATLDNVREAHRRSELAWTQMAERAASVERARAETEALRALLRTTF